MSLPADKIAEIAGAKVLDYSQYGNNGTRNFNSTSDFGRNYTDGKFSKALVFDGVNDYVNVSGYSATTPSLTAETWFKVNTPRAGTNLHILQQGGWAGSGT